ncbi:MAG: O-methyltransferase [Ignavibacteriaceae bacterium]|nr:O-methyltransferase [Ignavibacteriaceae bacterium]
MSGFLTKETEHYLEELFRQTDPLLKEMEQFAREKRIPIIEPGGAAFLDIYLRSLKPKKFLELGTAIGYSAIIAANALPDDARIVTIEKSADNLVLARKYINRSGFQNKITIAEGEAKELLRGYLAEWDCIFIDADKEDYDELFELSLPLLREGGVILIDNLLWHGYTASSEVPASYVRSTEIIRAFNKKLASGDAYHFTIVPAGDGIGVVIKKSIQE